jgi:hypothetical protein
MLACELMLSEVIGVGVTYSHAHYIYIYKDKND